MSLFVEMGEFNELGDINYHSSLLFVESNNNQILTRLNLDNVMIDLRYRSSIKLLQMLQPADDRISVLVLPAHLFVPIKVFSKCFFIRNGLKSVCMMIDHKQTLGSIFNFLLCF